MVKAGRMMALSMWWLNAGVAPVYHDYTVAIELRSPAAGAVIGTDADVRKWLPGDAVYDGTVYVPHDLPPGEYGLRIALLEARTGRPAIRLAIEGRQADGWYEPGEIRVE